MKTINEKFYRRYIEPTFPAAIYDQTCNMSVRNIDRILSQLAKKDLIRVQKRYAPSGRQIENSYKLIYRDYRS